LTIFVQQVRHGWKNATLLLQLRVLGLGFLQDGDVGVGIFPEREEIFVIKEWLPRGMAES
jgi:hypothetical protein